MNDIFISSKDVSSIKVDASIDNALVDEELINSVRQSNLIKIDFIKFCSQNGYNPISDRFTTAALYYSCNVEKEDFTREHWESLMHEYFECADYIKLNEIQEKIAIIMQYLYGVYTVCVEKFGDF